MKLNDKDRIEIWGKYKDLEFKLSTLKDIVQNPMDIYLKDLATQSRLTDEIIRELGVLNRCMADKCLQSAK